MTLLLNGKIVRDEIAARLKEKVASFKEKPVLAIIQIGEVEESSAYITQKKKFADEIGATVRHIKLPLEIAQDEVIQQIELLNIEKGLHGIILQLPVPATLNAGEIIERIEPLKDVDGLTATNMKLLAQNNPKGFVPATTKGVMALLEYYKIPLEGKKVLMIGRSMLVGKPTALALLNKNATVKVAHSKTVDLMKETQEADVIIVAIGKPRFIGADFVKAGQVIVDVGINLDKVGLKEEIGSQIRLVGDVDFDAVKDIVQAISPVPGGVGAMTVASLFENLAEAYIKQGYN
jgi:methylenetetrahydrofolate dehydrogenase (NADP+)/methenyltetrahydrofolate cyclohydrolase